MCVCVCVCVCVFVCQVVVCQLLKRPSRLAYPAQHQLFTKGGAVLDQKGQTGKCQKGQKVNDECAHYKQSTWPGKCERKLNGDALKKKVKLRCSKTSAFLLTFLNAVFRFDLKESKDLHAIPTVLYFILVL